MKNHYKFLILFLIILDIALIERIMIGTSLVPLLNPQGTVALQERNLIFAAVSLMLVVVVPVFALAFYVGWKYHANNSKAAYIPDWDHNIKLQVFIWGFPTVIICILAGMVWVYAHKLDPHVALASNTKPLTIQVVALRWKWLFIYPDQHIATLNYVVFPEKTPVHFELTASDTPMNSFWIPQLGGQIYAMSGMATQTHLIADGIGEYRGSNAEISGAGFADMTFTAKSVSQSDFSTWVNSVKQSPQTLSLDTFHKLAKPYKDNKAAFYSSTADNLYTTIVMKYMAHPTIAPGQAQQPNTMQDMPGM
ncbi:MAG: ubiquinol oxidase subunit II [Candidatus Levyibacteriota bacterium]